MNVNASLINKLGQDALKSLILETEDKEEVFEVLKFFRGVFCNKVLTGSTLVDMQESLEKFIRVNQQKFTGKMWLNIIEIARAADMPSEFTDKFIASKLDEVFMMENLSLKTVEPIVENLKLTETEIGQLVDKE